MKWNFNPTVNISALAACIALSLTPSCQRSTDDVWNDTKSAGRHVGRGFDSIGGKGGESRQVRSPEEFAAANSNNAFETNSRPDDFIPFEDEMQGGKLAMSGPERLPQPRETPGESGSSIPGIDAFKDPSLDPNLAPIFEHLHFEYNKSQVSGNENIMVVQKIADYMKSHPSLFIFVEGHCDQRGPAAYNFALGANRANAVRSMLAQEGISSDRIFTISYGKEKLLFPEEGEEFFRLNRRAQFKVWNQ